MIASLFVTDIRASQIAVALFETEDEAVDFACCLELCDLVADPLESCQGLTKLDAVVLGDLLSQRSGDDGHDSDGVLGHCALLDAACADVVEQQSTHLVTGDQLIGAVRAFHGDTDTVCVGVGCQHEVCADFLRQIQALFKSSEDLGVGIGAGGEIAVRIFLLGNDGDIGDAHILEDAGHGDEAGAVQRRVDQLEAGGLAQTRTDLAGFDRLIEGFLTVVADEFDESLFHAFREGHVFGAGQDIGLLDRVVDNSGCVIGHLAAVGAVGLEAVVLGGVVGSGDHDTRVAVVITGSKAQCGDRHQLVIDADIDAVGGQDACCVAGKVPAFQTAVIADGDGLSAALGLDPLGNTLRSLTDYPDVHAVRACAQCAAKTCCTEGKRDREALFDGVIIALDIFELSVKITVDQISFQPAFVLILIHTLHLLSLNN